jgi:hypothetical protein
METLRARDPDSLDRGVQLDLEMNLSEASYRLESESMAAAAAENLCRSLAGRNDIPEPDEWTWLNSEFLSLPPPGDIPLTLVMLQAALDRDSASQDETRARSGPGFKVWVRGTAGGALVRNGQSWNFSAVPGDPGFPLQSGAELYLPLDTPDGGREKDLRALIYRGERSAVEGDLESRTLRIETWKMEAEALRKRTESLEVLEQRSRVLMSTGEISPEDHEKVLMRQEDLLLNLGHVHRSINLETLGLRSISGSLGSWLHKEADNEGAVCNP